MRAHKFFNFKNAKYIIAFYILLLVPTIYGISGISIDYDFEKFFPKNDPVLDEYIAYRNEFGSDNDFLLVAFESKSQIISDSAFYNALTATESELKGLEYVNEVVGPSSLEIPIITMGGQFKKSLLKQDLSLIEIRKDPILYPAFVSKDGKNALILVNHTEGLSKKKSDELLTKVNEVVKPFKNDYTIRIAGKVHGQEHYISEMSKELAIFTSISVILLTVILFLFFRALWATAIPLMVILYSVALLISGIFYLGENLSVLTIILPTIIFVVGISDMVHLLNHYLEEMRLGKTKEQAVQQAVKIIGKATFLTSLTTAIGFLTLLVSSIEPVRQFGLYSAIGVAIAYILSFTFFPALLLLLRTPTIITKGNNKVRWQKFLSRCFDSIFKYQKIIYTISILIAVGGLYSFTQLKINNYLLEDWSEDDPQRKNYEYVEEKFGGVRPFDLILRTEKNLLDADVLLEVKKLEDFLIKEYKLENIVSPVSAFRVYNRAKNFGKVDAYVLETDKVKLSKQSEKVSKLKNSKQLKSIVSEDGKKGRLFGRVFDYGGYIFKQKNEVLNSFLSENIDPTLLQVEQTGMPYIINKNNEDLSSQMIYGLLIALAAVSVIMMLIFKDIKLLLISLIPNTLPLLGVALFMYLAGIDLKVSTAIIFTIAFGIAVDDTIHYLSRLKIEMNAGKPLSEAIKSSYFSSGKAIIITSIILCSGFLALVFSSFASTFYLGLLVSVVLLLAVLIDISLLPLLCHKWLVEKKR